MLIEEYVRVGVPLLDAIEQTANLRAGGAPAPLPAGAAPVLTEDDTVQQNEQALRELSTLLGN